MTTERHAVLDAMAQRLATAWRNGTQIASAEVAVRDEIEARRVQHAVWRLLEPQAASPGGWKVGAKGPSAPVGEAPLPTMGLLRSGVAVGGRDVRLRGIELELALRLGRDVDPDIGLDNDSAAIGSDARLFSCIDAVCSAIELVETRLADWDSAPPLAKQADLQSHKALVLGPWAAAPGALPDLRAVGAQLHINQALHADTTGGNTAQDLARLLRTLAISAKARGLALRAGQVITTGACTGLVFAPRGAAVRGQIDALPPVALRFAD
jgi:2-keto-4-pentenoate hydratase